MKLKNNDMKRRAVVALEGLLGALKRIGTKPLSMRRVRIGRHWAGAAGAFLGLWLGKALGCPSILWAAPGAALAGFVLWLHDSMSREGQGEGEVAENETWGSLMRGQPMQDALRGGLIFCMAILLLLVLL